jgi:resuscitation-promoting factor RpfA
MRSSSRLLAASGLALADLGTLVTLAPDLATLVRDLRAPHAWTARVGADAAAMTLAGAGLWCAALWLGLGLLAALAIPLPGRLGLVAQWLSRALLPAAIYRVLAGAAGLGILIAPAAAGARTAPLGPGSGGHPAVTAGPTAAPSAPVLPAPTWPGAPPSTTPVPNLPAPTLPATSRPPAHRSVPPAHTSPSGRPAPGPGVVVEPGDCLWDIAAEHLGHRASPADVAAAWPRWYAVNRRVVGAHPDLIQPGQHLRAPAATPVAP